MAERVTDETIHYIMLAILVKFSTTFVCLNSLNMVNFESEACSFALNRTTTMNRDWIENSLNHCGEI